MPIRLGASPLPSAFSLFSSLGYDGWSSPSVALKAHCKVLVHLFIHNMLFCHLNISKMTLQVRAFIGAAMAYYALSAQVVTSRSSFFCVTLCCSFFRLSFLFFFFPTLFQTHSLLPFLQIYFFFYQNDRFVFLRSMYLFFFTSSLHFFFYFNLPISFPFLFSLVFYPTLCFPFFTFRFFLSPSFSHSLSSFI